MKASKVPKKDTEAFKRYQNLEKSANHGLLSLQVKLNSMIRTQITTNAGTQILQMLVIFGAIQVLDKKNAIHCQITRRIRPERFSKYQEHTAHGMKSPPIESQLPKMLQ